MTLNDYEEHGGHLASPPGSVQVGCGTKNSLHLGGLQGKLFPQEGAGFHNEHTTHYVIEKLKGELRYGEFFRYEPEVLEDPVEELEWVVSDGCEILRKDAHSLSRVTLLKL